MPAPVTPKGHRTQTAASKAWPSSGLSQSQEYAVSSKETFLVS